MDDEKIIDRYLELNDQLCPSELSLAAMKMNVHGEAVMEPCKCDHCLEIRSQMELVWSSQPANAQPQGELNDGV